MDEDLRLTPGNLLRVIGEGYGVDDAVRMFQTDYAHLARVAMRLARDRQRPALVGPWSRLAVRRAVAAAMAGGAAA